MRALSPERAGTRARSFDALPGIILAAALAVLAGYVARLIGGFGPGSIGNPVLLSILLGLAIGNSFGRPDWAAAGLRVARDTVLKLGIVLLGFQISLTAIGRVGAEALPIVLACITVALVSIAVLVRMFGIGRRLGTLIAVGTSICGCTAIVATAPVVRARESEICYAIACVALFGTAGMLAYPLLAHLLFATRPEVAGIFLGTAIHDTSQVIGAGMLYEQYYQIADSLNAATVTKLLRNLCMLFVIPILVFVSMRGDKSDASRRTRLGRLIPLFVIGFLGMSVVRSLGDHYLADPAGMLPAEWTGLVDTMNQAAGSCLIVAMAAVGLSTPLSGFRRIGYRPILAGLTAMLLVGMTSLVAIRVLI